MKGSVENEIHNELSMWANVHQDRNLLSTVLPTRHQSSYPKPKENTPQNPWVTSFKLSFTNVIIMQ